MAVTATLLAGCEREARLLDSDQPLTPPVSDNDPRDRRFAGNVYQTAQGGRYFTWYGCAACHGASAKGALDLNDNVWRHGATLTRVYSYIAQGHAGALSRYGRLIPTEQLWQLSAYVRDLPRWKPEQRRRQDVDQAAEPQGKTWGGPLT